MATQFDPIAKDESLNTTESPSRNVADVLAQGLDAIEQAIAGGSGSGGHTIVNASGTDMTQRAKMQFVDAEVTDDAVNDVTKISTTPASYPSANVTYGSGSVEDALDALNAGWTFLDSVSVTGGTGSTNNKAVTLPNNAKEYLLQSFIGNAITGTVNMLNTQTEVWASVVGISTSGAITSNYGGHFNRSTSTLESVITYRSGGNITVGARLFYR